MRACTRGRGRDTVDARRDVWSRSVMAESSKKQPRGKPWPKGQSGNPKGLTPLAPEVLEAREQARQWLQARSVAYAERLDDLTRSEDEKVALAAVLAALDRSIGRPPAAQEDRDALAQAARPPWLDSLGRSEIVAIARKALVSAGAQTVDAVPTGDE